MIFGFVGGSRDGYLHVYVYIWVDICGYMGGYLVLFRSYKDGIGSVRVRIGPYKVGQSPYKDDIRQFCTKT